eukprot:768117-Hanusia_phi.AAC.7
MRTKSKVAGMQPDPAYLGNHTSSHLGAPCPRSRIGPPPSPMPLHAWRFCTKGSDSLSNLRTFFRLRHGVLEGLKSSKEGGAEIEAEAVRPNGD